MLDLFTTLFNIYNLRNFQKLYREQNKTSRCGTETVIYKAFQLWKLLSQDIKSSPTLIEFKDITKTGSPEDFPCHLCQTYLRRLGYIDIDVANTFSMT